MPRRILRGATNPGGSPIGPYRGREGRTVKRQTVVVLGFFIVLVALAVASERLAMVALPLGALAVTAVLVTARPRQLGWRLASVGAVLWTIEETAWAVVRLSGNNLPTTLTDIAAYAGSAFWLAALLTLPGKRLPNSLTIPFLPAIGLLLWLYTQDTPRTVDLRFPLVEVLLVLATLPALEAALRGRASEGRLLWTLGFFVRALTAGVFSWLFTTPGLVHGFLVLWLLPYAFLAVGASMELRDDGSGLWAAASAILGLEAATALMLTLLYRSGEAGKPFTVAMVLLLGYFQFAAIMLLLLSDRRRRIEAEGELKAWGDLLNRIMTVRPEQHSALGTLKALVAALAQRIDGVRGVEVYADGNLRAGTAHGYAYPLVTAGAEVGRLYFDEHPRNSNVLDAVAPFLAGRIQQALDQAAWQTQAVTDPLTGLLNRRGFDVRTPAVIARAQEARAPVSVAMLDLDHFKRVNDYYDHATGDRALRELSAILKRTLRTGDLAFRWGGEEFLVLLVDADQGTAEEVVRRIRQELRGQTLRPISWPLTLSAGIAGGTVPEGEDSLDRWIAEADAALSRAKDGGRDRVEAIA